MIWHTRFARCLDAVPHLHKSQMTLGNASLVHVFAETDATTSGKQICFRDCQTEVSVAALEKVSGGSCWPSQKYRVCRIYYHGDVCGSFEAMSPPDHNQAILYFMGFGLGSELSDT